MSEFHCKHALTPDGWAQNVILRTGPDGLIESITEDAAAGQDAVQLACVLPGLSNLHSHAFQRGMAGLSEHRGPGDDSFWTWRDVMYRFNDHLQPEDVETIAAMAYCEMIESGFTRVAEFHYLHHAPGGETYEDRAEMAGRIVSAARTCGIGLTLLPVFYRWAGFGQAAPEHGQRRFVNTPDSYADLIAASRKHLDSYPGSRLGIAPHSLRAASMDDIRLIRPLAGSGPVHIHIAEQVREVDDCEAATGARPVNHLLDNHDVDAAWCLVHATHLTPQETERLAGSGAIAGLCPQTEANLGDGLFPMLAYRAAGGRYGIGTDSHIRIDAAEEIRLLEYGQRLMHRGRNLISNPAESTGRTLLSEAVAGGAQACGIDCPALRPGAPADFVELDLASDRLAGRSGDNVIDSWIFSGDGRQLRSAYVSGKQVVSDGAALARPSISRAFRQTMAALSERIR